jgi:hypothetical protein
MEITVFYGAFKVVRLREITYDTLKREEIEVQY